jgi:protoporphyrinogen oxidase
MPRFWQNRANFQAWRSSPQIIGKMAVVLFRHEKPISLSRDAKKVVRSCSLVTRSGSSSSTSNAAVAAAAQTLGRRTLQEDGIRSLLEGKFASSMRMVAAQMTLEEMHEQRRDYANQVRDLASEALAANGLELENVAIVDLDQTSLEYFDPSNAFDAEGLTQLNV